MRESFDHCPPRWIRQSGKRCTQFIHNHMVVDYLSMSSVNFAIPNFCSPIPNVPALEAGPAFRHTPESGALPFSRSSREGGAFRGPLAVNGDA
jgi:hypothetical protein